MTLGWYVGGGEDSNVWVNEEHCQYLAMPWLSWILETEGCNAVLQDVWESQYAAFACQHPADILYRRTRIVDPVQVFSCGLFVLIGAQY